MATHPVEPPPRPSDPDPAAPNPSHLPVEPEFDPPLQPGGAEPQGKPPQIRGLAA